MNKEAGESGVGPRAHAISAGEVMAALRTSPEGLAPEEASARLGEYGPNELPREPGRPAFVLFLKQFAGLFNYVLYAAAGISVFTGHLFDACAIMFEVVVNGLVGFFEERKAEKAILKLKEMVSAEATVKRGGRMLRVAASAIVPGDLVFVTQGDRIPADLRLYEGRDLRADESALTGESVPVEKKPEAVQAGAVLADRRCMLFMGTLLLSGEGWGVATSTGQYSAFGSIARSLATIKRAKTHLEKRIDRLGGRLALIALGLAAILLVFGLARNLGFVESFLFSVAAAVSALPEGLPVVLAIVLAIGVQRMARRGAVIRHFPAVETLGSVDVICSDKTGTLTENKMTVRSIETAEHSLEVTGEGWDPAGEFMFGDKRAVIAEHPTMAHMLRVAALCNRAALEMRDGVWSAVGDPTECALLVAGQKAGFVKSDLLMSERTYDDLPFSPDKRYRAILHGYDLDGLPRREIMVVGALEAVLKASVSIMTKEGPRELTPEYVRQLENMNGRLAGSAMRVVAVATKEAAPEAEELRHDDIRGLTVLGLAGMIDPPRKGVAEAVRRCAESGIKTIMLTGDHKDTAVAVAREIGLLDKDGTSAGYVLTEEQVAAMGEPEFRKAVEKVRIFARVSAETKLRVVAALKAAKHVVAVTGDGINDAPALKEADIGVAMGRTGTDVTREVADMVLTDDNFVSIVNAVEEGRIVYRNVKQTAGFLVMTNTGEMATIFISMFNYMPLPLLPAQLLWLNVVTDGFTDVALATEPRHGDELGNQPHLKGTKILSKNLLLMTGLTAVLMAACTLWLFQWARWHGGLDYGRSVAFLSMSFFQLWNVFSMRSPTASIFKLGWFSNRWVFAGVLASVAMAAMIMYVPFLQPLFRLVPLGWKPWALTLAVSASVVLLVEGYKALLRRGIIPKSWI